jgi:hypothetical protein
LHKTTISDTGSVQDRRLQIVIAMLRQVFGDTASGCTLQWIPTWQMVADGLTKKLPDDKLIQLRSFMASQPYIARPPSATASVARPSSSPGQQPARTVQVLAVACLPTSVASFRLDLESVGWGTSLDAFFRFVFESPDIPFVLLLKIAFGSMVLTWFCCCMLGCCLGTLWSRPRGDAARHLDPPAAPTVQNPPSTATGVQPPNPATTWAAPTVPDQLGAATPVPDTPSGVDQRTSTQPAPAGQDTSPRTAAAPAPASASGARASSSRSAVVLSETRRRRRAETTPTVSTSVLESCMQSNHELRPGSNATHCFLTCLTCRVHRSWPLAAPPRNCAFSPLLDGFLARIGSVPARRGGV